MFFLPLITKIISNALSDLVVISPYDDCEKQLFIGENNKVQLVKLSAKEDSDDNSIKIDRIGGKFLLSNESGKYFHGKEGDHQVYGDKIDKKSEIQNDSGYLWEFRDKENGNYAVVLNDRCLETTNDIFTGYVGVKLNECSDSKNQVFTIRAANIKKVVKEDPNKGKKQVPLPNKDIHLPIRPIRSIATNLSLPKNKEEESEGDKKKEDRIVKRVTKNIENLLTKYHVIEKPASEPKKDKDNKNLPLNSQKLGSIENKEFNPLKLGFSSFTSKSKIFNKPNFEWLNEELNDKDDKEKTSPLPEKIHFLKINNINKDEKEPLFPKPSAPRLMILDNSGNKKNPDVPLPDKEIKNDTDSETDELGFFKADRKKVQKGNF